VRGVDIADRTAVPRGVIVTVGDEILLGQTVDTNAAWLGRELALLGVPVVRRYTVADLDEEIRTAVAEAAKISDLVLVSGGLGPTPDDLTRDAVAGLLELRLLVDPALLERLESRFRERGYEELPRNNRSQAMIPEGARVLANPYGTAPGLVLEADDALVVLLPGIPRELRGIFSQGVRPLLEECFGPRMIPVGIRLVHTTGIPESLLAQRIGELLPEDTGPVGLAFLPDLRGVDVRFTATGVEPEEAERWFDRLEEALEPVLGPWRFEAPEGDLVEAVSGALRSRGLTLAVAESCTGGLISKRVTDRPGSSKIFVGGVVAYANEAKQRQLGLDQDVLEREGAVSETVARAMAHGVAERFGADTGIGVTGIAGPDGATEDKPVGTVWYAVTLGGETVTRHERFTGDRAAVRERAAQAALALLLRLLEDRVTITS